MRVDVRRGGRELFEVSRREWGMTMVERSVSTYRWFDRNDHPVGSYEIDVEVQEEKEKSHTPIDPNSPHLVLSATPPPRSHSPP
jgi:hypothetical protein